MNAEIKTNVIKRNGEEVAFDLEKIINAIKGANKDVDKLHRMNEYQIMAVADNVAKKIEESTHAVNVEDILPDLPCSYADEPGSPDHSFPTGTPLHADVSFHW